MYIPRFTTTLFMTLVVFSVVSIGMPSGAFAQEDTTAPTTELTATEALQDERAARITNALQMLLNQLSEKENRILENQQMNKENRQQLLGRIAFMSGFLRGQITELQQSPTTENVDHIAEELRQFAQTQRGMWVQYRLQLNSATQTAQTRVESQSSQLLEKLHGISATLQEQGKDTTVLDAHITELEQLISPESIEKTESLTSLRDEIREHISTIRSDIQTVIAE